MNTRPALTAGQTAGLTLVKGVRPTVSCAWCGALIAEPKRGQRWCTPKHRVANSEARRAAMAGAVHGYLVGLMLRRVIGAVPTVAQVDDALEVAGAKRRARLMDAMGLTWVCGDMKGRWE